MRWIINLVSGRSTLTLPRGVCSSGLRTVNKANVRKTVEDVASANPMTEIVASRTRRAEKNTGGMQYCRSGIINGAAKVI